MRWTATSVSIISDLAQASAAIIVAIVAVYGIRTWKRQTKYDRRVNIAADVLSRVSELADALIRARNPLDRFATDPADSAAFKRISRERKAARINELTASWNRFMDAATRVELWEDDFCKTDIDAMKKAVFDLWRVFPDYNDWEDRGWGADANMEKLHREWGRKLVGTPDDDFGKDFSQRAENVKAACKKLIR